MGAIYIIRNRINDCVYIGKTERSCEIRWREHLKTINNPKKKSSLHLAMEKYGVENFYYEVLEDCISPDRLNFAEKQYIKKFDSFRNGYNRTVGGEGESHVDHNLIIDLFDRGYLLKDIHALTGYSRKTISSHVNAERVSNIHKRGRKANNGKMVVYNGMVFNSHDSLVEYLINNDPMFIGKLNRTVMNYVSKHMDGNVFKPKFIINDAEYKKQFSLKNHSSNEIVFNGVKYGSYKELAIFLKSTYEKFKHCRVNTIINGISYSVKNKKPYKSVCFY